MSEGGKYNVFKDQKGNCPYLGQRGELDRNTDRNIYPYIEFDVQGK